MKQIIEIRAERAKTLAKLGKPRRTLFSLLCAERLRICVEIFALSERIDTSPLWKEYENILGWCISESSIPPMKNRWVEIFEEALPPAEMETDLLSTQAIQGFSALVYAANASHVDDPMEAVYAAECAFNALDCYIGQVQELSGQHDPSTDILFFQQEVEIVDLHLKRLSDQKSVTHEELSHIRFLNLARSISPAILA